MIKTRLLSFNNNPFLRSVSTLALGTIVSQSILFLASPLLTRLFSPSDFGILALFTSVSTIAAIVTTGRYELAIGLPEKDSDGAKMVGLVVTLCALFSLFYLFIIIILKQTNLDFVKHIKLFNFPIVYLIPIFTFFTGLYSALQYWNQRKKRYKRIALGISSQVLSLTIFNIIFGLLGFKTIGLIGSLIIGQIIGSAVLFLTFYSSGYLATMKFGDFKATAIEYISFPKYSIVSDLALTISQQVIPIVFSLLFNSNIVGFFSIANRMLRIPSIVLTSSIGNVFRNEAIDMIRNKGNCKMLYASTFKKLVFISVPLYIIIFFLSPWAFSIFFGKQWVQSGYFAQIICLMLLFEFIASPLSMLFYIMDKQKVYMRLQVLNSFLGILMIFIGNKLFGGPFYSIFFFAVNSMIFSLISLLLTYNMSKRGYVI